MTGFPAAAHEALADAQLRRNLRHPTTTIRSNRARAVAEVGDWEALRDGGARIKDEALARLDVRLETLEAAVTARAAPCTGRATAPRPTRSSRASCVRRAPTRSSRSSRWPRTRSS